jgi:hypothetical protein
MPLFTVQNSNQSRKNLMKLKLRVQSGYMHKSKQKLKACRDSYTTISTSSSSVDVAHQTPTHRCELFVISIQV